MKNPNEEGQMPPAMLEKLQEVRARDRKIALWTGLHRSCAILLGVMLAAMAIDWLVVLHDARWRWALTLLALGCAVAGFAYGCLLPLLRPRSLADIAREVDRAHPSLEERYLTLAGFAQSKDDPAARGSAAMIQQVAQEATAMTGGIAADSVIPKLGLIRARQYLWGVSGVLLLLLAVNFSQTKVLCERFWMPGANLSLTQLRAKTGDVIVGKGESVTLEITEQGRATASASLFIRSPNHNEVVALARSTNAEPSFVFSREAVADSFEYRAQAGDGETAWHRVTVLERPQISQVKLRIVPPAYSHLPTLEEDSLPRRASALEGSEMEVSFQCDQPLASMEMKFGSGKSQPIAESADHSYHFRALLTNTLAFTPVFTNLHHLDNLAKTSCEIVVYPDQPPTVTVVTPNDKVTARPDDKVKIEFEARDDIGLAKAELVATVRSDTNETSVVIPIPLGEQVGAKQIRKQVELDLAQFKLKQNQELSYVIRVTDTKENPATSSPNLSDSATNNAEAQLAEAQPANPQNSPMDKPADQQRDAAKNPPDSRTAQSPPPDNKVHLAMKASLSKPPQDASGAQPPPNNMSKRVLDAGQCSACQPMRIIVDEWGDSFEGQLRDKLEIAIDPVLKSLDELLGKAQQLTDTTLATGKSAEGLSAQQRPAVDSAKDDLRQADAAVTELKKVSHDTPYAFIGLQVHDIRETHISPARKELGDVLLEPNAAKDDLTHLEQASFQIKSAREKLANLTKTYESVKRENKMADAMQKLAKMHQIFIEDTQALLGSKKPVLNPQDRKVAEVSDEYADKLKALLEEQKKIMAELSKILADDPRLLRRFLALQELDGASLRDQMTLLAGRQRALADQVTQWASAAEPDREALLTQFVTAQAAEQKDVAERAAKLQENMVTWLPLGISPDEEAVVERRKIAAEAARLAGEAARQTSRETLDAGLDSARQALAQLHLLHDSLPGLEWIPDAGDKISVFEANRMSETADLITRQSGWVRKMESLRAGDYTKAAEVDQHRITVDTTELGEKLDSTIASVSGLSAEIKAKSAELNTTVHKEILPEESSATDALSRKIIKQAAAHQGEATNSFAKAETQFDDLLHLIIAKLDAAPPPTDPGKNKSLDDLLAMLQDEKKTAEGLGIPCRPINVSVMKDWLKSGSSPGNQQGQAQARAAQNQARLATQRTQRARDNARKVALQQVAELPSTHADATAGGPKRPTASWNTLVSQLGDEIQQGRDNVPPEQYRKAIEQYFNTISDKSPAAPAPAEQAGR